MNRTPVVVSWSGGKDSTLALQHVLGSEQFEVAGLLTTITKDYDRISIHGVRTSLLAAQCRALDQQLFSFDIPAPCSNIVYEDALTQQLTVLREAGIRDVVFGDLFLADVRAYRERLLQEAGMRAHFPLWHVDTTQLAGSFISGGFRGVLVCVDPAQLAAEFCGRDFDQQLLDQLPAGCDPCGERGEFHTFVFDGPIFKEAVPIQRGAVVHREHAVFIDLLPAQ